MRAACALLVALALLCCLGHASAFYLPGVAPRDYAKGDVIEVKVVKLDSVKTHLPFDYYSLPFCRPPTVVESAEGLGEILSGDRIENSPYKVIMDMEETCQIVCRAVYNDKELKKFAEKIDEEYRVNWLLDALPAATKYYTAALPSDDTKEPFVQHYEKGFPLGFVGHADVQNSEPGVKYLNNHLRLVVFYHQYNAGAGVASAVSAAVASATAADPVGGAEGSDERSFKGSRIVGFEVEAYSVNHQMASGSKWQEPAADEFKDQGQYMELLNSKNKLATCNPKPGTKMHPQRVSGLSDKATDADRTVIFTYDVHWEPSNVKWASRWDLYLKMTDSKIHWFSIINSIMIVLFLSGMVAVIMLRILHRDLTRYNNESLSEEEQREESGWKLVHGDVFRPPAHGGWFAVLVGTGVQVFAMTLVTLVFAALGFLSPANRGALMTALLVLFVLMGMLAGYHSTRVYKMFGLPQWKKNTLWTALFFPGLLFSGFFVLNLFVWHEKSSGAVPFETLLSLLVLWLGISVPLVYLGSYVAFRKPAHEHPTKVNNLCRLLPPEAQQSWYTNPQLSVLLGGVLPFAAVFIEIFFIMSSVWLNQFYYVFGFLFAVFIF